jgi:hypothetical protein
MITLLLHLLRLLPFLFGGHRQLAIENLALRHQVARRSTPPSAPSSEKWPPPIRCGALPESMENFLKLGIEIAERTVSRLIPKRRAPPSQTWRTFLTNHVRDLVSIDFFTVPTAQLRVLFVLASSLTTAAASYTSTSPRILPRRGSLSRSSTLSPTTPPLPISSAIETPPLGPPSASV